jgi:uncharacterized protein
MTAAGLVLDRVTLVSLVSDGRRPLLPGFVGRSPASTVDVVVPRDGDAQRTLLAARLDAAIHGADRAVMLVAEGASCMAAAWWARLSPRSYVSRVAGALMIAPEEPGGRRALYASPRSALPFPSVVIGADDATQRLAAEWGSRIVDGPLPAAPRAPSRRFLAALERFSAAIVERDVRAAERLLAAIGDG